ncbi:hypothetical protein BA953_02300 [Vibrio coralliilyticus]|uniref:DUF6817 domain-containing protein n=1 Tax=Vibrio coralliilyticus TaxID=190893 RepID=UPI000810B470|nr:hypothetical protein [Vibrio coralliilyticus]ANW23123.1 hypothetical protein BA953_02300 [Vibrio coralliilyticus]
MNTHFERLKFLGAGDFQHLNGSLESHLVGTESLLAKWHASDTVRSAGLFHAAYGTAGFDESMVSLEMRSEIAAVIGREAEALVYLYCSCDRDYVFPQFDSKPFIQFRDRFTGSVFEMTEEQLHQFCELTVANELELVLASEEFKLKYGQELWNLFEGMAVYLSESAKAEYKLALADCDTSEKMACEE